MDKIAKIEISAANGFRRENLHSGLQSVAIPRTAQTPRRAGWESPDIRGLQPLHCRQHRERLSCPPQIERIATDRLFLDRLNARR